MAFVDFKTDPANIAKGHMMDAHTAAGADLDHILIRAAMVVVGDGYQAFTPDEVEALRAFRTRGISHYPWTENARGDRMDSEMQTGTPDGNETAADSTPARPEFEVVIIGPNLRGTSHTHHVHKPGCRDLAKPLYASREHRDDKTRVVKVTSEKDVTHYLYPPDQFEYDGDTEWRDNADFKVFPCVGDLPDE